MSEFKNNNKNEIDVSILGANFLDLKKILDIFIKSKKIKRLHYDVMDYDFVNNLSFGPHILNNISNYLQNKIKIDCHMMTKIKNLSVEYYLKPFIESKVEIITFHLEALSKTQLDEFLKIREKYNQKIGIAIKPNTSINEILHLVNKVDLILIMSVEPGFGGQIFIKKVTQKINELRYYLEKNNLKTLIQVDGGINKETFKLCENADILVIGNYLTTCNSVDELLERINLLYDKKI